MRKSLWRLSTTSSLVLKSFTRPSAVQEGGFGVQEGGLAAAPMTVPAARYETASIVRCGEKGRGLATGGAAMIYIGTYAGSWDPRIWSQVF